MSSYDKREIPRDTPPAVRAERDILRQAQFNLNTLLMFIALAVMGWIGNEAVSNGRKLASMEIMLSERATSQSRLENKVDELSRQVLKQRDELADLHLQITASRHP